MKQEEIKPGDILYNTHTKAIVKVARIDDNGCVKYSAYGKEPFTFYIEEYPYKMGADHADVFVPATDKQRKYIENQLSTRVYGYIPESTKTSDALIMRLGLMVKENVELEQRVHHLVEDYNRVARQLRGEEKRKEDDPVRETLGEIFQMRDHCDELKKEIKNLRKEIKGWNVAYERGKKREDLCVEDESLKKYISGIDAFVTKAKVYACRGTSCPYVPGHPAVSSTTCLECGSCLHILDNLGVVCLKHLQKLSITTDE